ncbi:MAG: aminomethyl-transferring glycine dehydrogenase subunit GcvPB [Verrucomicrobiales bacterium]
MKDLSSFALRHLGSSTEQVDDMLETVGFPEIRSFIEATVPADIRLRTPLNLPAPASEQGALAELKSMMSENRVLKSFIGLGYYGTITPPVIQRNVLENPGWYTAYTPYQPEISQGRLEALLNFQTMICDLTGLDVANASLLDEATAAAEAMHLALDVAKHPATSVFISETCFPQTIAVVKTRMAALGIGVIVGSHETFDFAGEVRVAAALVQYPAQDGEIHDCARMVETAHKHGALAVVAADLLALVMLRAPGEFGADICVGSAQRFGVPLGFGGPHAGFMAVKADLKRNLPGRLVGVSVDVHGNRALRLSLQTREQHIRRDKATSNICTAQVLLAVMAAMYAVWHGPEGLRGIAERVHGLALDLRNRLQQQGVRVATRCFFDTLVVSTPRNAQNIHLRAHAHGYNLRPIGCDAVGIAFDETSTADDVKALAALFDVPNGPPVSGGTGSPPVNSGAGGPPVSSSGGSPLANQAPAAPGTHRPAADATKADATHGDSVPRRTSAFLDHPVFNTYHTEHEMLRYLHRLEAKDIALNESMIPLGSCTMKLNATAEMMPLSWPEVSSLHPFAPADQAAGYLKMFSQLEAWLAEICGLPAVSLQPNSGAQGEYAGLLAIRAYHLSRGEAERTVCLIPVSAHGTNPASAVMAGLQVVPVKCDTDGNIDVADLRTQAEKHATQLAALMVTYPSTHGVFEETIREICEITHAHGGQVYMDGANMNAQVGLTSPASTGADVCHLNLHKTFCIPHGGGGPGAGPIAVAQHLAPFLPATETYVARPDDPISPIRAPHSALRNFGGPVSAAPWGSASIFTISWMYIRMMGAPGLTAASEHAILNANYISKRLARFFPTLYAGRNGTVAHECILDLRAFQKTAGIKVEDVAKRLIDYGFHAPTMSWPVPGTLMVEPTESESMQELDRFCDAMIAIHDEIRAIERGELDRVDNPLKNAPHTALALCDDRWSHRYSRETAAFPARWLRDHKFWPPVGRVDNVYGDKNLVCTCGRVEDFA